MTRWMVLFVLLLTPRTWADDPKAPVAGPKTPEYVNVTQLPGDITLAELSNGLTVIVRENHVAPVATVRCYVKNTGAVYEGRWLGAGLSHLVEHLVAGGTTKNRSEKEIELAIDEFGGATNAFTSSNLTAYFIDCPADKTDLAIDLIADSMQHVTFEQDEFDREYEVVQRELADGEVSRTRVQWKMLSQTVYTQHPMRHPTIGYLDVLKGIDRDDCQAFYRERYVPNNQVFVVVGDVDTEHVLAEIAKRFAGTGRGRETFIPLPEEPEQVSPRDAVREMEGGNFDFVLAWPTVNLSHPDLYALDVASYILTEGDSSRMQRRLIYEEGLALGIDSASYTPHMVRGIFAILGSATPDNWLKAVAAAKEEVDRLKAEPVSDAELAKAKKQKAAELVFGQQTVQDAAESLARSYIATGDALFDKAYVEGIQKVTAEDVQRVAKKYFVPERLSRVVIAPPGMAPKRTTEESAGAEQETQLVTLENGLRILVKRHSHLPLVNMQAYVLAGNLMDTAETAGRSGALAAMLDKGTANHTAVEIAKYFDSVGGTLGMSAGRFTIYGSAAVLKEDFPKACELFAESFLLPSLPETEFTTVKTRMLGAIAQRAANPQAEVMEALAGALPATTPFHVVSGGTKKSVEALTVDDLRKLHSKCFVPQNMIVTLFGDIDPEKDLEIVKKHFGAMPKTVFSPLSFERANLLEESVDIHRQIAKPTAMVLMAYPTISVFDKEEYAAQMVFDAITSGYGYPGGWLHNDLRGAGLVYYVHAFPMSGPSPGYMSIMAQTRPDALGDVIARIDRNLQKARNGEFTPEEFVRAQAMLKAMNAQDNTTIGSMAQKAALDELYGLGYDYHEGFDERVDAVTLDDVKAYAAKYFDKRVLVTSSPAEEGPKEPLAD
jgi:zinc protease